MINTSRNKEDILRKWTVERIDITQFFQQSHTFFKFSPQIRKLIYTTNVLEGFNRQVRKFTKVRTIFPTDESLNKCVYLATMEIMEKWTQPIHNWGTTLAELSLYFEEQLKDELA